MPKSMKKQCKIDARKSDAKNMKKHQKSDPQRRSKVMKNWKNIDVKKRSKKERIPILGPARNRAQGNPLSRQKNI